MQKKAALHRPALLPDKLKEPSAVKHRSFFQVFSISHITKYLILWILLFSLSGCLETEVSLTGDDYKIIDSLYTKHKDSLIPILDTACTQFQDSVMQLWVDSIMQERQQEIENLIAR